MKKVCTLLDLLTYLYHNARFIKCEVNKMRVKSVNWMVHAVALRNISRGL